MNVKEIIIKHLKDNGFDGLCNPEAPCGCGIDDLAPCGDLDFIDCQPAYKVKRDCPNCESQCDGFDENGTDACFTTVKPK